MKKFEHSAEDQEFLKQLDAYSHKVQASYKGVKMKDQKKARLYAGVANSVIDSQKTKDK